MTQIEVAVQEGGAWLPAQVQNYSRLIDRLNEHECLANPEPYIRLTLSVVAGMHTPVFIHAVRLPHGGEWDAVHGWRDSSDAPGALGRTHVEVYTPRAEIKRETLRQHKEDMVREFERGLLGSGS